jgi:hypothetical protein
MNNSSSNLRQSRSGVFGQRIGAAPRPFDRSRVRLRSTPQSAFDDNHSIQIAYIYRIKTFHRKSARAAIHASVAIALRLRCVMHALSLAGTPVSISAR